MLHLLLGTTSFHTLKCHLFHIISTSTLSVVLVPSHQLINILIVERNDPRNAARSRKLHPQV